jgi:hypothetical protein
LLQSLWPLVITVVVLFFLLLWLGYSRAPGIFGFGSHIVKTVETVEYTSDDEETGQPQKRSITTETQSARTVWEWLTVLTISTVIAVVALMFSAQQAEQQRKIQVQQASDDAVQTYFDQMGTLLIEEHLRTSAEDSEARTLARSRTLTILSRLDPERRSRVLQFLLESELVQRIEQKNPVINLSGANLSGVSVPTEANLSYADLSGTDLSDANLSTANVSTAYLTATNLHNANLSRATLSFSDLGLADLSDANLSDVDLTQAKLNDAVLTDADLTGAHLWRTDLTDAKGVTQDTLEKQARYVGKTTMRDGHVAQILTTNFPGEKYAPGKIPAGFAGVPLPDGEYDSDEFVPAFHFEVDEGWQSTGLLEETDFIALGIQVEVDIRGQFASTEGELSIINPSHVLDASNLREQKEIPAPENADGWVSWFKKHPKLETSEPIPKNVGSASGMQVDATLTSTPENYVDLYASNFTTISAYADRMERFIIVDVGEETVVVNVSAPADKPQEVFSKAKKLLATVEWTDV